MRVSTCMRPIHSLLEEVRILAPRLLLLHGTVLGRVVPEQRIDVLHGLHVILKFPSSSGGAAVAHRSGSTWKFGDLHLFEHLAI